MKAEQYLFTATLILLFCALGYVLFPVYAEFRDAKRAEERLVENLMHLEYDYQRVQEEIHALRTNPRAVERVAREKFGWCKPDETIYHFDPPPLYLASDSDARNRN